MAIALHASPPRSDLPTSSAFGHLSWADELLAQPGDVLSVSNKISQFELIDTVYQFAVEEIC